MLSDDDIQDRIALKRLFDKRAINEHTKQGFFYFEDAPYMIVSARETYVIVAQDMAVGYPLFMTGELDFHKFVVAMALIKRHQKRSIDTLWDVGANIGSICIPAVRRNYVSRAYAFEPEAKLYKLLRANVVLNEVDDRVTVFRTGLGCEYGKETLMMGNGNTGDYRILGTYFENDAMGERSRHYQEIEMSPLDHFSSHFEIGKSLLWIDVQGYEGFVLGGAKDVLKSSPPLVTEFWPYGMRRLNSLAAFKESVCAGLYNAFFDLSSPASHIRVPTQSAIQDLYDAAGDNCATFTDLLFLNVTS